MKKNRPVDKLYKTIENAQKKLDAIRKICKHKKYRVELYSWRIGSIIPARLCNKCDAVVPGITEAEGAPLRDSFAKPLTDEEIRKSTITLGKING